MVEVPNMLQIALGVARIGVGGLNSQPAVPYHPASGAQRLCRRRRPHPSRKLLQAVSSLMLCERGACDVV